MKPTAWYDPTNGAVSTDKDSPVFTPLGQVWPLYLPHTWTGLTDEERKDTLQSVNTGFVVDASVVALAIEAKLKEKNNG